MDMHEWWQGRDEETRDWLIAHNGEPVRADVLESIVASGGVITSAAWWVGGPAPDGFHLSDEATDWIETVANGEQPPQR